MGKRIVIMLLTALMMNSQALDEVEKQYLTQILNQLQSLPPLIVEAQKHQTPNQRIPFHYDTYTDAKGQKHSGLQGDVQILIKGVKAALDAPLSSSLMQ